MAAVLIAGLPITSGAQTPYKDGFLKPTDENRPLIIWQWMDGLVTKEGITKDLEAFKAAGLAGGQNFQIGEPRRRPDMRHRQREVEDDDALGDGGVPAAGTELRHAQLSGMVVKRLRKCHAGIFDAETRVLRDTTDG